MGTHLKDTTPDSGVVADNSHSNSSQNVGKITSKSTKEGSSQNSLLSSNSSTGEQPIWQIRNPANQANSTQNQGKEYSRVEGNNQPDTLFSSSASSGGSENGDEATDRPAFRWDGTPLVDKSKESQFLKKVKSMDTETCNLENS